MDGKYASLSVKMITTPIEMSDVHAKAMPLAVKVLFTWQGRALGRTLGPVDVVAAMREVCIGIESRNILKSLGDSKAVGCTESGGGYHSKMDIVRHRNQKFHEAGRVGAEVNGGISTQAE